MQQQHHTRPHHMRLPHTNNIQIHPAPLLQTQPPTQQRLAKVAPTTTAHATQQHTMQPTIVTAPHQHMRELQNRSNNPKHMPTTSTRHNQSTQMQKIRQQHQHLNHKLNTNSNNVQQSHNNHQQPHYNHNLNAHQLQQQQQLQRQQTHNMGALHQQQQQQAALRNVPGMLAQTQQQHIPHQYNSIRLKNPALKLVPTTNTPKSNNLHNQNPLHQHLQQQQQQQNQYKHSFTGNKLKYNNNNNHNNHNHNNNNNSIGATTTTTSTSTPTSTTTTEFSTPKAILQNPNRISRPKTQSTPKKTITLKKEVIEKKIAEKKVVEKIAEEVVVEEIVKKKESVPEENVVNNTKDSNDESQNSTKSTTKTNDTTKVENNKEANKENEPNMDICTDQTLPNEDPMFKNAKEKTSMCLVNELARYNKITHQYRLTGEKGPPHSKRFTVTLKLGDEEYTAEGYKIKKAQHCAAALALEKTSYKHPVPKLVRNHDESRPRPYIMPTVELNALAMKLGQQTYYLFDPRQMPPSAASADILDSIHDSSSIPTSHITGPRPPLSVAAQTGVGHLLPLPPQNRLLPEAAFGAGRRHFDGAYCGPPQQPNQPQHMPPCPTQRPFGVPHRGFQLMHRFHQRFPLLTPPTMPPGIPHPSHHMHPHFGLLNTPYKITLIVGKQKFVGTGRTMQHAKHDAASRALLVLKNQTPEEPEDDLDDSMDENDVKSPISQVHEEGIKRNVNVHFKILREEGPAHMRNFITACIMDKLVTEGEGHGKKVSKKRAAEKMLLEIKKLPPVTTPVKQKRSKSKTPLKIGLSPDGKSRFGSKDHNRNDREKRVRRNGVKGKEKMNEKEKANENDEENPVTKLIQLMQMRGQKEPAFEYISKAGGDKQRRREFIVEVTAEGLAARGTGSNKKIAKRNAAESLLSALLESDECIMHENSLDDPIALDSTIEDLNCSMQTPATTSTTTTAAVSLVEKPSECVAPKIVVRQLNAAPVVPVAAVETKKPTQVPGILVLRQKGLVASTTSTTTTGIATATTKTPAKPVKVIAKHFDNIANSIQTTQIVKVVKTVEPKPIAVAAAPPAVAVVDADTSKKEKMKIPKIEKVASVTTTTVADSTTSTTTTEPTTTAAVTNMNAPTNVDTVTATSTSTSTSTTNSNTTAAAATTTTTITETATAVATTTNANSEVKKTSSAPPMMKHQLLYLAKLLGFEVNFSDYPKGNHSEILTIVTLSTDPPQICHGLGKSTDESQNDAAHSALKILSDLGLNN